ncbi:MAG: efflux RND transporter periplasmic adaptor subunit [Phycisphaeraceae bacterium]|nr:efflux RND transporter periplasmic adaptor subunit [Phycisphaeraceae bacterium]
MKTRLIIVLVFVAFFAFVGVIAVARLDARREARETAPPPEAVPVRLAPLATRPYALTEKLYGVIEARAAVDMSFIIAGRISLLGPDASKDNPVTIDEGVRVRRGETLAVLDPERYDAAVDSAFAELSRAEATLERTNAQIAEATAQESDLLAELERTRTALDRGAGTERDLDRAQRLAQAATARRQSVEAQRSADIAQIRAAEAMLATANAQREDATLRAPFDGVIAALHVEPGETVSPGKVVLSIIDDRQVRLRAGIVERKAPLIREGQAAHVTVRALEGQASLVRAGVPESIEGVVTLVTPSADPATGLFGLEITIDNDPDSVEGGRGWLRPGMIGRATIRLAERELMLVPEEAALDLDGQLCVFLAQRAESGELVSALTPINPIASDDRYYLLETPPRGAGLVIEGQTMCIDGEPIREVED